MTGCAICSKYDLAVINIPRGSCRVCGWIGSIENLFAPPAGKDPTRNHLDLLLGQHSPGRLREGGHRCSPDAVRDNVAHGGFIDDGQIHGIGECDRRSSTTFRAVAARTVLCVESAEVQKLVRGNWFRIGLWFTIRNAASNERHQAEDRERRENSDRLHLHRWFSPFSRGGIVPGASIPARKANEVFSRVGKLGWRTTTSPATIPKATCEAMNQSQSMRLASSGFSSPRIVYRSPDHSTGAISPPSTIGRRRNMGSIAPQSTPTKMDTTPCRTKAI